MPSNQGGLVQYFDAEAGIELDPKIIVATGLFVAIFIQMAK
ncbi:MAG: preprotein translocase subunit Sec61beta, partial [Candidatus Nanohaloarchaea archaeon]